MLSTKYLENMKNAPNKMAMVAKNILAIALVSLMLCGCMSYPHRANFERPLSKWYTVKKVRRQPNGVYFVYATRNDTIFKIFSRYDGLQPPDFVKLKRGMKFTTNLWPFFNDGFEMVNYGICCTAFFGVIVWRDPYHGIEDIYYSSDFDGRYICEDLVYKEEK